MCIDKIIRLFSKNDEKPQTPIVNSGQTTVQHVETHDVISGFTAYGYCGKWQLGRFESGSITAGDYGEQKMYSLAILTTEPMIRACFADFDVEYHWGIPGPTNKSRIQDQRTILLNNKISIPNGGTAFGIIITTQPNLQPPRSIELFEVK